MLKTLIPLALRQRYWAYEHERKLRARYGLEKPKYLTYLANWQRFRARTGTDNTHYERRFLAIAGETSHAFVRDKIIADLGCGPLGSLCWATEARARIGIDVLADAYRHFELQRHDMVYVWSREARIPLPSDYVDVLFTANAMDHADNFGALAREALRILAPGGLFIASLNLNHAPNIAEPQPLTEELVRTHLLRQLDVQSYRIAPDGPDDCPERYFFEPAPAGAEGGPATLWLRAVKKTI